VVKYYVMCVAHIMDEKLKMFTKPFFSSFRNISGYYPVNFSYCFILARQNLCTLPFLSSALARALGLHLKSTFWL